MARRITPQPRASNVATIITVGASVAALYFAQDVLLPIALAVMVSFLLATPATWLERHRFGRVPSVLIVVIVALSLVLTLGYVVGKQVYSLAESLPQYQEELARKAKILHGNGEGIGNVFSRVSTALSKAADEPATQPTPSATAPAVPPEVTRAAANEIGADPIAAAASETLRTGAPRNGATSQPTTMPGLTAATPLFVTNVEAPLSPVQLLATYGNILLGPLGTAGLVLIFVIFVLLEREGMRDRLIRLVSRGKYTITTKAINDAATRISRYLIAQSIVNGSYGLIIAFGLWIIGHFVGSGQSFPSFVLWGLLCAVLRFIPYVGPWIGASFPLVLSLMVYPGFSVFIAVIAMFVIVELFSNNAMEPWLYGASTGLSTVAILVAAVFWTWLWGPIGLLLSTPLTVCIVVTGKYVAQLSFFDVLLGDSAALPPAVSYYQRLLAGDRLEASHLARDILKEKGREYVPDEVFVPALLLARRDRVDDALTAENETSIYATTAEVLDETLRPIETKTAKGAKPETAGVADAASPPSDSAAPLAVLGCPAHHRAEELTLQMLARLLGPAAGRFEIASTRLLPSEVQAKLTRESPRVVFIAIMPPGGLVQARFLIRRLRKASPDAKIIVGYFGKVRDFDRLLNRLRSAGANSVTTSMYQSYRQLQTLLGIAESSASSSLAPSSATSPGVSN